MHLRRNNNNRHQDQQREQHDYHDHVESEARPAPKVEPAFDWNKLTLPKEVRELAQQRKVLSKKMQEVDNRLRFGYSEPLYEYKMELIKEDIELSCKMTEKLITL